MGSIHFQRREVMKKKQSFFTKLWVYLILLSPLSAFASSASETGDSTLGNFLHSFTPSTYSQYDLSMKYLGQIFGSVGGVLSGQNGQLIGRLFEVFNNGLMVVAGLFLGYTVFKAVVDTASEGEVLGRGTKTAWIAFRTAMGIGCLIPSKASGYCLIQGFFMYVVIQGVGFADMIWQRVVNYLADEGGAVYVTNPISPDNMTPMVQPVGQVMQSEICMYRLQNTLNQNNAANAQAQQEAGVATDAAGSTTNEVGYSFVNTTDSSGKIVSETISFGKKQSVDSSGNVIYGNECGSYLLSASGTNSDPSGDEVMQPIQYQEYSFRQVILDLGPAAEQIANLQTTDQLDATISNTAVTAMTTGVMDYVNIITPALKKEGDKNAKKYKDQLRHAEDQGWIVAGSYYRQMANINNQIAGDLKKYLPGQSAQVTATSNGGDLQDDSFVKTAISQVSDGDNSYEALTTQSLEEAQKSQGNYMKLGDHRPIDGKIISNIRWGLAYQAISAGYAIPVAPLMGVLDGTLRDIVDYWDKTMDKSHGDPIVNLQKVGNHIVDSTVNLWFTIMALTFITTIGFSAPSTFGVIEAMGSSIIGFIPTATVLILTMLGIGLVFSVYVPLIPFLVYLFAVLGWFVLVVEAMFAAPLVAIGITHPDGDHYLMGKSSQALMMLLNIFIRPSLLLTGFLIGMVFERVSLTLLNDMFHKFGTGLDLQANPGSNSMGLIGIGLLVAYTMIVVYVVQFAFEMCVAKVPAFVSGWLNIHSRPDEIGQAMEVGKGAISQVGSGTADGGGRMLDGGARIGSETVKNRNEQKRADALKNNRPTR